MKITGATIVQLDKTKPKSRCRKWRLCVSTDHGRKFRRFTGTWTQACEALDAFVAELSEKIPNADTFGCYAASWALWREKSGDFAAGTIANDKRNLAMLARSPLWEVQMDQVTPTACRDALLWVKQNPAKAEGELSGTTMNKVHVTLNAILKQAADDGLITRNPMERIKPPKVDTREKEALTPDELMLLLNRLDELHVDGRVMAVYLMACLGLRRGEACALLDSDIDNGLCYVHLAVKERDGSVGEPKSKAGMRVLPVPPRLQAKVDEWRAFRDRIGWHDSPTLACNTQGGMLRPQMLQRWWAGDSKHNGVRDAIGCPGMTMHQLRHSNLSMMARHMSPFDLQRYAGWSSIEPAKVYVHDDLDSVSRAVTDAWDSLRRAKNVPEVKTGQSTRL